VIQLQSDVLCVTIDDGDLSVAVTDVRCTRTWRTPGPGLALRVRSVPEECAQWWYSIAAGQSRDWLGNQQGSDCAIHVVESNATLCRFHIQFSAIQIGLEVCFELKDDRLLVSIPEEGWDRSGETLFEVLSVDLLPLFGAQPRGSAGYMVLPHGGGTLRYFADHPDRSGIMADAMNSGTRTDYAVSRNGRPASIEDVQTYDTLIYNQQSQWRDSIWAPVWGQIVDTSGFAAHIPFEHGDVDAQVVVSANNGEQQYCGAHARFCYRHHVRDEWTVEPRQLVLTFLHENDLDWNAIGRAYRRHLVHEVKVNTLADKCRTSPVTEYVTGAYYLRPMLALKRFKPYDNPHRDGSGVLDVYLTCDDLIQELRRLKAAGIERALVQLVGFNTGGHDGLYPTIFPIEPAFGGEDGLRRLIDAMYELDYRSSVHVNVRCYASASSEFNPQHVARDAYGGMVTNQSGPMGDDFHACPWPAGDAFAQANEQQLLDLGLDGGMYYDFVLGVLVRCYDTSHGHATTRRAYMDGVRRYLQRAREVFGNVRAENVIAPLLDLVDYTTTIITPRKASIYLKDSELRQRGLADESVPLLPVIYHGLVQYATDSLCLSERDYWAQVLDDLSLGATPIEEHRSHQAQWDDLHSRVYRVFCDYGRWLQCRFIESIERVGHTTCTRYDDGTRVLVNHGEAAAQIAGQTIPPRSFRIEPVDGRGPLTMSEDVTITQREPSALPNGAHASGAPLRGAKDVAARWRGRRQIDSQADTSQIHYRPIANP